MVLLDNYVSGPNIDATITRIDGSGSSDFLSVEKAEISFNDGL